MKCPCCLSELERGEDKRLQTLDEHVCRPNDEVCFKSAFHCSNSECDAHKDEIIWNRNGERYGTKQNAKWIDDNDGPIPSISRRLNVECYKHDKDYELCKIFDWLFKIKFHYSANKNGDILKRWRKLQIIRPDNTVYNSGPHMLKFSVGRIFRSWKVLGKRPDSTFHKRELMSCLNVFHKDEWWRKISRQFARVAIWHRGIECELN